MIKRLLTKIILSAFSIFGFWYLESGFMIKSGDELIKSIIFGITLFIAMNSVYRKYLFLVCFFLLTLMTFFYLFWQITWADRFGSLGFGMLFITSLLYLPAIIKKGYVEKL